MGAWPIYARWTQSWDNTMSQASPPGARLFTLELKVEDRRRFQAEITSSRFVFVVRSGTPGYRRHQAAPSEEKPLLRFRRQKSSTTAVALPLTSYEQRMFSWMR